MVRVKLMKSLRCLWKRICRRNDTALPDPKYQWISYIDPEHIVEKHISAIKPENGFEVTGPSERFNPSTAPRHWWFTPDQPAGKQWYNVWDGKYYACPRELVEAREFILARYKQFRPHVQLVNEE